MCHLILILESAMSSLAKSTVLTLFWAIGVLTDGSAGLTTSLDGTCSHSLSGIRLLWLLSQLELWRNTSCFARFFSALSFVFLIFVFIGITKRHSVECQLVKQVILRPGLLLEVNLRYVLLCLARDDWRDRTIESVHTRHKLVQLIGENVSFLCVVAETVKNLVFVDIVELLPVFNLVKAVKQLALAGVAQEGRLVALRHGCSWLISLSHRTRWGFLLFFDRWQLDGRFRLWGLRSIFSVIGLTYPTVLLRALCVILAHTILYLFLYKLIIKLVI